MRRLVVVLASTALALGTVGVASASATDQGKSTRQESAAVVTPQDSSGGGYAWLYTGSYYGGSQIGFYKTQGQFQTSNQPIQSVINHSGFQTLCGYNFTDDSIRYGFKDGSTFPTIGAPFSSSRPMNMWGWHHTTSGNSVNC